MSSKKQRQRDRRYRPRNRFLNQSRSMRRIVLTILTFLGLAVLVSLMTSCGSATGPDWGDCYMLRQDTIPKAGDYADSVELFLPVCIKEYDDG